MSDSPTADEIRALTQQVGALVERLDRLVGLMEGALSGSSEPSPAPTASGPSASGGDASAAAPAIAGAPEQPPVSTELGELEVQLDDAGRPLPGGWTTVGELLTEVFRAALHADADTAFLHYQRLMHHDAVAAPQALTHLEVFQWKKLRERVGDYLQKDGDPSSFVVLRRDPDAPTENDPVCRVFVKCRNREPVPTRFRRDPSVGQAWRIESSSL